MRLLVAGHHAARVGGVETYIQTIVPALAARGFEVGVWYEQGSGADRDPGSHPTAWFNASDPRALDQAADWGPSLVFAHGLASADLEDRLLSMAPSILFAHSYFGTCISGAKTHAFPSAHPCTRRFGAPCLALYYPRRCGGWSPLTAWSMYRRQARQLRTCARYRRILVASRHMADEYARHGLGGTTVVVPLPAVDHPAAALPARTTPPWRLLYLGRLVWSKGPDIAVQAAARAAVRLGVPVHLTVAGSGSLEPALRRSADRLAAESRVSFDFTGHVDPDARRALFLRTDLLVVPSRWPEPFGLVGNEAGLHGIPAVGFAAGGIPEWLTDGVNGRLVTGRPAPEALAIGIADVLRLPETRAAMGASARRMAGRFSLDAHVGELERVFRDVAGEAGIR